MTLLNSLISRRFSLVFPLLFRTKMSASLMERVAGALAGSYAPSGDESATESAATQIKNEEELESLYADVKSEFGIYHVITVEIFLRLFDVLIGMYRLDKCDALLVEILPAIDRLCEDAKSETVRATKARALKLKGIQCLAFTRWKQGRLAEALTAFNQMEEQLETPSPALFENMAHTYSSMGDFSNAKKYFQKAIDAGCENKGGVLLGLGLLSDRTGEVAEGLAQCKEALEWYEEKFSKRQNESSLEAKCCMSIAKLSLKVRDVSGALEHSNRAVGIFRRTCGEDSPLVAAALKTKGEILASIPDESENALAALLGALKIESIKDALDMLAMMDIVQLVMKISQKVEIGKRIQSLKDMLEAGVKACANVRTKMPQDGNSAAFYKFIGELAVYAQEPLVAKELLTEAIPLFQGEKTMDCSGLVKQCQDVISLINSKI